MAVIRCSDCLGTGVVPVKFIPGVDRDYCGSCGGAGQWESDPRDDELAAARRVVEAAREARPFILQPQHRTDDKGGPCSICGLRYSPANAYVPCDPLPEAAALDAALAAYDEAASRGTREGE